MITPMLKQVIESSRPRFGICVRRAVYGLFYFLDGNAAEPAKHTISEWLKGWHYKDFD